MVKRAFAVLICMSLIFTSGCSVIDKITEKTGKEDMKYIFSEASLNGNTELMGELIGDGKITQEMLDSALYNVGVGKYEIGIYLLEKGADPNYKDMPQRDAFNDYYMHMMLLLTSDKTDVNQKNPDVGRNVLYQAMENTSGGDEWGAYNKAKKLIEKGAEIDENFFVNERDAEKFGYGQINRNPLTVQMLIKKYLADGGKLSISDPLKYAFCGEIDKCIGAIEKSSSDLTPEDRRVIACFTSAFGNVKQYEKVCKLLSTDNQFSARVLAGCGNLEMLKYTLKKDNVVLKTDKETMKDMDFSTHYSQYAECLSYAASWGNYDICKYLMDEGIYPELAINTLVPLSNALISGNFKVFKEIYNYIETNFEEITEEQLHGIFNNYGKNTGLSDEMSDFDKQVLDFLFENGHTFEKVDFTDMHKTKVNYLIENGVEITHDHLKELIEQSNKEGIESVLKKGCEFDEELLERAIQCCPHDIVKLIIDSGVKLPDNIMETAKDGSKATAKVLIEAGAKTDLKFTELKPTKGHALVQKGDFDLTDYYKHYNRDDLAELLD